MWQQAYVIEQLHGVAPRWHEDLRARMGWNGMHGALVQPGIMTSCSHVDGCVPFSWNTTSWTQMTQIMTPLVRPLAPTVELAQSIAPAGVLVPQLWSCVHVMLRHHATLARTDQH